MVDLGRSDGSSDGTAPVYAHIGAMKTGTTFIQLLLEANREPLAEAGFCVPAEVRALRSLEGARKLPEREDPERRAAMLAEVGSHTGRASLLSWEFLSFAARERAERVVSQLPTDDVHVVLTVRDAAATLPGQWQTMCRNRTKVPWSRFVEGVAASLESGGGKQSARVFRRSQDVARMLDVWVPLLGADRVHVVTVPPRGSDPLLLWRRFAEVIGADPEVLATTDVPRNPTLGWPSSELLRRLNLRVRDQISRTHYHRVVRAVVARALESRVAEEPPIRVDGRALQVAARWNHRVREAIVRHEVPVVGSLDELPDRPSSGAAEVVPPTREELLAAAATARDALVRLELALTEGRRALRRALIEPTPVTRWSATGQPLRAAVQELAELVQRCAELDDPDRGRLDHLVGLRY